MNERLGIIEQRQADRATYGRFAYRAPIALNGPVHHIVVDIPADKRTVTRLDPPKPASKPVPKEDLREKIATLEAKVRELQDDNERIRSTCRIGFIPPSIAKPEAVAVVFCREMKAAGYEIDGFPYMIEHLTTVRRSQIFARPRHVFMWCARRACSGYSLPKIGKFVGGRDHSSCMHGCYRAPQIMREDPMLRSIAVAVLAVFGIEAPL